MNATVGVKPFRDEKSVFQAVAQQETYKDFSLVEGSCLLRPIKCLLVRGWFCSEQIHVGLQIDYCETVSEYQ